MSMYGMVYGRELHPPVTTAQTLAPNYVTSARSHRPYLGYFGFIFVQGVEVEMHRPYLCTV